MTAAAKMAGQNSTLISKIPKRQVSKFRRIRSWLVPSSFEAEPPSRTPVLRRRTQLVSFSHSILTPTFGPLEQQSPTMEEPAPKVLQVQAPPRNYMSPVSHHSIHLSRHIIRDKRLTVSKIDERSQMSQLLEGRTNHLGHSWAKMS
jgi:hypothetical protein